MKVTATQLIDAGAKVARSYFGKHVEPCGYRPSIRGGLSALYDTNTLKSVLPTRVTDYQKKIRFSKKAYEVLKEKTDSIMNAIDKLEKGTIV